MGYDHACPCKRGLLHYAHYWATYGTSTAEDLDRLKKLNAKYGKRGLAIIGVNLDHSKESMENFLKQNQPHWAHLHENGGFDSRLAVQKGIFTVPTMILVDQKGNVVNRNIHVEELAQVLSKQFKKR